MFKRKIRKKNGEKNSKKSKPKPKKNEGIYDSGLPNGVYETTADNIKNSKVSSTISKDTPLDNSQPQQKQKQGNIPGNIPSANAVTVASPVDPNVRINELKKMRNLENEKDRRCDKCGSLLALQEDGSNFDENVFGSIPVGMSNKYNQPPSKLNPLAKQQQFKEKNQKSPPMVVTTETEVDTKRSPPQLKLNLCDEEMEAFTAIPITTNQKIHFITRKGKKTFNTDKGKAFNLNKLPKMDFEKLKKPNSKNTLQLISQNVSPQNKQKAKAYWCKVCGWDSAKKKVIKTTENKSKQNRRFGPTLLPSEGKGYFGNLIPTLIKSNTIFNN